MHPVDASTIAFAVIGIALWLGNVAVKAVAVPIERVLAPQSAAAADHTILLAIGLGILAESAVVVVRALDSNALVVWEKGEDGAEDTRSAAFDTAQKRVASGVGFRTRDW